MKLVDLSGVRFSKLLVVSKAGVDSTRKTTWNVLCDCGGTSIVTGLNLKSGTTKSCGCLTHRKGPDNPRYRPIPPDVRRDRKRAGAQFRLWRKSVLARCPTCIRCGAETSLQVHHLNGFDEFPVSRFDPLNGITLCLKCHTQFHVVFGRRKGFTEMQAEKFVDSPIAWLVTRHAARGGVADLMKARHYLDLHIESLTGKDA